MDIRSEKYLQVKPMITAAAWDLSRRYPSLTPEDALGECNLQFAKCMDKHDPEKGALTTYTAQILRATRSNIQDRFCAERGIPRARRSKKEASEAQLATAKAIDYACASTIPKDGETVDLLANAAFFDPEYQLFMQARTWEKEDQALLNALYVGTEKGIDATGASISRNFPAWRKGQAKERLSKLRKRVFEVIDCTR